MPPKFAFVFPGQGAQFVGMGKSLAEAFPQAAHVFQQADDILGFPLSELCFNGPEQELTDTSNSQPAIFATSIAAYQVIKSKLDPEWQPCAVAGHSLGEYTALVVSGAIKFEDGLKLVRARGLAMKKAGGLAPGGMLAVLGANVELVEEICSLVNEQAGNVIQLANDNCPGQVVVSGNHAALSAFISLCSQRGVMAPTPLKVSVATHSRLMETALPDFLSALETTAIYQPILPVIGNVTADYLNTEAEVRTELNGQLTKAVRWTSTIRKMASNGINTVVEVGPGKVLTGLIRRTDASIRRLNFGDDPNTLDSVLSGFNILS